MMEISPSLLNNVLIPVVKAVVIVNVMAIMSGVLTIIERRSLAFLQVRKGPNRVGWEGSLQWVADTVKLLFKEDIVPAKAEHLIHFLAPVLVVERLGLLMGAVLNAAPSKNPGSAIDAATSGVSKVSSPEAISGSGSSGARKRGRGRKPPIADSTASTISTPVIVGGDSCTWCSVSGLIRERPKKVSHSSRNI